jgi:hypothetical protein
MMAPAPIEEPVSMIVPMPTASTDLVMPELSELIHGLGSDRVEG